MLSCSGAVYTIAAAFFVSSGDVIMHSLHSVDVIGPFTQCTWLQTGHAIKDVNRAIAI